VATYRKRSGSYQVLWKELVVLRRENGEEHRRWKQRSRTVPTEAIAKQILAQVEAAAAYGERWEDRREQAVVTIRAVGLAFVRAAVDAAVPITTQRFRSSMIGAFLNYLGARDEHGVGAEIPVSTLTLTLLENYAKALPSDGRKSQTRYRKVMEAERMWAWAFDRPERFPGVPPPRRYTGGLASADKLSPPPPVVAVASPTWADVDSMIAQLGVEWHRRAAMLMRFTGLRSSQACGLQWHDLDLERSLLRVRSRVRGAKRSRARVVPLNSWLVAEMTGWGAREGLLFPRRYRGKDGSVPLDPYRGDALVEPFRRAWKLAKVPEERWGIPDPSLGERGKGSPTHAVRRCIRTEMIRSGVQEAVVLYLVGQTQGFTAAAYVPESSPEESPYWPRLVEAVNLIPPVAGRGGQPHEE